MHYIRRGLEAQVTKAARAFPAAVLTGPRRAGRTFSLQHVLPHVSDRLFGAPEVVRRFSRALWIAGALLSAGAAIRAQAESQPNRPTLYYIPHTHWEGAVFKTREDYLTMGLPNILKAVHLLKEHPD